MLGSHERTGGRGGTAPCEAPPRHTCTCGPAPTAPAGAQQKQHERSATAKHCGPNTAALCLGRRSCCSWAPVLRSLTPAAAGHTAMAAASWAYTASGGTQQQHSSADARLGSCPHPPQPARLRFNARKSACEEEARRAPPPRRRSGRRSPGRAPPAPPRARWSAAPARR